jgi:hypothetical protein
MKLTDDILNHLADPAAFPVSPFWDGYRPQKLPGTSQRDRYPAAFHYGEYAHVNLMAKSDIDAAPRIHKRNQQKQRSD